jgi:metallophosphoesterase (TIGR00282 family)
VNIGQWIMQNNKDINVNILFIADIVGLPGYEVTLSHIQDIQKKHNIRLSIANGENGASGKGLTAQIAQSYFDMGIDVITSGNHIWNRDKFFPVLDENPRILRPLNYPPGCPGHGSCIVRVARDYRIGVINLQGRSFMYSIDCPFLSVDNEIQRLNKEGVRMIIIDFHAEATAEKIALGWYLDGRVSAVIGSHTHVQTADERILPHGTAYITDAGMTGPFDSVIGMEKQAAIRRFLTQIPVRYKIAQKDPKLCGVILSINANSGKSLSISRFQIS